MILRRCETGRVTMTPAQRARLRTTPFLLRAMIPLAVLVIGLVVLVWPRGTDNSGVHEVDPAPVIAQARQLAPYTVLAPAQSGPTALPAGWRATSARMSTPDSADAAAGASSSGAAPDVFALQLGYITTDGMYAQYQQSNDSPESMLVAFGPRTESGDVQINGVAWRQGQRSSNGETLLFRTYTDPSAPAAGPITLIVTGNASLEDLKALAGSLV